MLRNTIHKVFNCSVWIAKCSTKSSYNLISRKSHYSDIINLKLFFIISKRCFSPTNSSENGFGGAAGVAAGVTVGVVFAGVAGGGVAAGVLSGAVWETAGVVAGAGVVSVPVVAVLNHPHEFSYIG